MSEVLDTSLTPAALKKLSRSVMDLSAPSLSDVTDISRSTAGIFTDGGPLAAKLKKIKKGQTTGAQFNSCIFWLEFWPEKTPEILF